MKFALYAEDGITQVVLTPESETERGILGELHKTPIDLSIRRGSFYECRGGWVRYRQDSDDSTMIVVTKSTRPQMQDADAGYYEAGSVSVS